jgi:transmembrane sensor
MSSLNIRTARAAIWFTRVQGGAMTERRMHMLNRWLAVPGNNGAFKSVRAAWHNSRPPAIQSSSHRSAGTFERGHSSQRSILHHRPSVSGGERLCLVSEEAAYWYFLCVDDPSMLRSDRREFLAWMRRSPENIAELFKIAQLDGKLRRLRLAMRSLGLTKSNVVEFTTSGSPYRLHREINQLDEIEGRASLSRRTLALKLVALAASLFFGVALAFVAQDYMQSEQVVTTGASQWHYMILSDGTAVHVDARSRVEVAYTDKERIVHVYEGSAVFDVAKDPNRPFIARTRLIDAMAVGTRFGVALDPGVTTTVSEGVVVL